ncbi:response regulator [Cereibacter sphaeroides]|nr:response regulator [Cereibacter sphaeroides]
MRTPLKQLAAAPDIAILLTDVGLPGGMTGRELAAQARADHPDLRIVFMTGYDDEGASGAALDHATVLLKPFDFEVMVQKMIDTAAVPRR